jgi:TolB-like protein/AraC-like DNA-binding protein
MSQTLSMDQVFLRKLTEIIEANLENEKFGVEEVSHALGMSRSNIHRKLKSIAKKSLSQYIREFRLQRAMEMLRHHEANTSEIAFRVGFSSPAYFTKCFHEYYGYPPGDVKKRVIPVDEGKLDLTAVGGVEPIRSQANIEATPVGSIRLNKSLVIQLSAVAIIIFTLAWFLYHHFINGQEHLHGSQHKEKDLSIVVLPFKNFSDDPNNQYFADGIMEDILNHLYRISDLRVISRTTSEHFRGTNLTVREIAQKVNARNVLEGSVRRYGDKARISVQLIDAYRDQHLWSANFDRELNDLIGIQGDIALQVAFKLNAIISESEIRQIGKNYTQNPQAFDYYLKGRFLLNKATNELRVDISKDGLMSSIQYFEKAITIDQNFSQAYASLASAWFNLSAWGWYQPYIEGIQKAKEFSMKALQIDPDCSEAHAVKGAYLIWPERKWEEGRKELLISLQLNPNYAFAHQAYAQLLMITGPIEEARIHMDRANKLEPYFWVLHNLDAWIYYFEGRYNEAVEACHIAHNLKSDYIFTDWLLFLNYAKLNEGKKAAAELQIIARHCPEASQYADEIMDVYNKSGIPGLFTWLIYVNINNPVPAAGMSGQPFFIAWWYAILGNRGKSLYWLERNMESELRNYTYFNLIATNPDFDILRSDPRFLAIIEQIGLTPYQKRAAK